MAEKHAETISPRVRDAGIEQRAPWSDVPFGLVRRLADEVDHLVADFGFQPVARKPWRMFPAMRRDYADLSI
jgi:hypothetical protein